MLSLLLLLCCSIVSAAVYDWPDRYGDHIVEIPRRPLYDRARFCFGVYTTCRPAVVTVIYDDRIGNETSAEPDETSDAVLFCSDPLPRGTSFEETLKCGKDRVLSAKAIVPPAPPRTPRLVDAELTDKGWLKLEVDSEDDTVVEVHALSGRKLGRMTICRPCLPLMVTSFEDVRELTIGGGVMTAALKFEDPFDGQDRRISSSIALQPLEKLLHRRTTPETCTTEEPTSGLSSPVAAIMWLPIVALVV